MWGVVERDCVSVTCDSRAVEIIRQPRMMSRAKLKSALVAIKSPRFFRNLQGLVLAWLGLLSCGRTPLR